MSSMSLRTASSTVSTGLVFLSNNYEGWDQKTFAQRVRETLPPERYRRVELPDADFDVQPAASHSLKVIALRKQ